MQLRLRSLVRLARVRWDQSHCEMWVVSDSEWFALQLVSLLLFTMPPGSALRTVFRGNVLSLLPRASLDLTGTLCFFFFVSIKIVLFLAHCVKTRLSHPVYVCAHWNNFPSPQGLSGLFSYMCWNPVFCASHCMQTHYATLCISRGATGPERQPATNHSPPHLPFLSRFHLLFLPLCSARNLLFCPRLGSYF